MKACHEVNLGIDLDETIINTTFLDYENRQRWKVKEGAMKYIPILHALGFKLHLITARSNKGRYIT
jgi:hypothetical protein